MGIDSYACYTNPPLTLLNSSSPTLILLAMSVSDEWRVTGSSRETGTPDTPRHPPLVRARGTRGIPLLQCDFRSVKHKNISPMHTEFYLYLIGHANIAHIAQCRCVSMVERKWVPGAVALTTLSCCQLFWFLRRGFITELSLSHRAEVREGMGSHSRSYPHLLFENAWMFQKVSLNVHVSEWLLQWVQPPPCLRCNHPRQEPGVRVWGQREERRKWRLMQAGESFTNYHAGNR